MSNSSRQFRKYPQTIVIRCPCCKQVYYAMPWFDINGEAEYRCNCGYLNKIKLIKNDTTPNDCKG